MNAIKKSNEYSFRSIAMPAISTGRFGFPKHLCAKILVNCAYDYANTRELVLETSEKVVASVDQIHFTDKDDEVVKHFEKELEKRIRKTLLHPLLEEITDLY